jgi:hypothetical protein
VKHREGAEEDARGVVVSKTHFLSLSPEYFFLLLQSRNPHFPQLQVSQNTMPIWNTGISL